MTLLQQSVGLKSILIILCFVLYLGITALLHLLLPYEKVYCIVLISVMILQVLKHSLFKGKVMQIFKNYFDTKFITCFSLASAILLTNEIMGQPLCTSYSFLDYFSFKKCLTEGIFFTGIFLIIVGVTLIILWTFTKLSQSIGEDIWDYRVKRRRKFIR